MNTTRERSDFKCGDQVEAKRRELEEAKQAEEDQAAETAELDQWLNELGDDANSAALKMQAKQRQKMAKKSK